MPHHATVFKLLSWTQKRLILLAILPVSFDCFCLRIHCCLMHQTTVRNLFPLYFSSVFNVFGWLITDSQLLMLHQQCHEIFPSCAVKLLCSIISQRCLAPAATGEYAGRLISSTIPSRLADISLMMMPPNPGKFSIKLSNKYRLLFGTWRQCMIEKITESHRSCSIFTLTYVRQDCSDPVYLAEMS
jgi:hypothetical protein